MLRLAKALAAWGTPAFEAALKQEVMQLGADQMPLQQGLARSSHVADSPFGVTLLRVADDADFIHAKLGIMYAGIIAGCSCTDDPTPMSEQSEYCEVMLDIDKLTADTAVTLLPQ